MTDKDSITSNQDKTLQAGTAASQAADLAIGDKVGGDYLVESWIGAGGMGNVYRVTHTIMQSQYALKTLSPDKISEAGWLRFKNEAQAIARLNHKNVVGIYNLGLHDGHLPYYVMDLLEGRSLYDELRAKGPLLVDDALTIFKEVIEGIGHAHKKGVVHRDIKPANIMLLDNAKANSRVKIVDFGIVKISSAGAAAQQLTNAGEIFGSPYYMSPEQCQGGKIDARSDIYSLGCTIYECLTGVPPYRGHSALETMLMHQNQALPTLQKGAKGREFAPAVENLVAKMIAKAPINRYQSMDKVGEDLSAILAGQIPTSSLSGAAQQSLTERQEESSENKQINQQQKKAVKKDRATIGKLVITAVLLIITASGLILSLSEKPVKKKSAVASIAQPAQSTQAPPMVPTAAQAIKESGGPIKISRDALGHLHCFFPEKESIGRVVVAEATKENIGSSEEFNCQGHQVLPWGKKLGFYPTIATAGNVARMQSLAACHFHSCTLPKMDQTHRHEADTALTYMSKWRGLERLDTTEYSALTNDDLMVVKNYPDLNQLLIQNNVIDCKTLIASKIMTRLHVLALSIPADTQYFDNGNLVHVLDVLAKTGKLDELILSGHRILPEHLEQITQMQKMRKLTLNDSGADSVECQVLTRLKKLEQFSARNCLLDSLAIPYFQEMAKRSLKTLDLRSHAFTPEIRRQYQKALPKVTIL